MKKCNKNKNKKERGGRRRRLLTGLHPRSSLALVVMARQPLPPRPRHCVPASPLSSSSSCASPSLLVVMRQPLPCRPHRCRHALASPLSSSWSSCAGLSPRCPCCRALVSPPLSSLSCAGLSLLIVLVVVHWPLRPRRYCAPVRPFVCVCLLTLRSLVSQYQYLL